MTVVNRVDASLGMGIHHVSLRTPIRRVVENKKLFSTAPTGPAARIRLLLFRANKSRGD